MSRQIKRMFGRRVMVELTDSYQQLANGIKMKKEVQSRRELVSGTVLAASEEASDNGVEIGDTIIFPFFSANEAERLGKSIVTIDYKDIEWSEDN